jgi:hypothetical protein
MLRIELKKEQKIADCMNKIADAMSSYTKNTCYRALRRLQYRLISRKAVK